MRDFNHSQDIEFLVKNQNRILRNQNNLNDNQSFEN